MDDSEEEGPEPRSKDQERMLRKLQRKFPHLNKNVSHHCQKLAILLCKSGICLSLRAKVEVCDFPQELRDVLQEHSWLIEDALETLRMFSDLGEV